MLRVGLTGNIGSGKSTAAEVWEGLGARVIDADRIARDVLSPGSPALDEVLKAFGDDVLDGNGKLDRKKLAGKVFGDPDAVALLNGIIHPPLIRRIRDLMSRDQEDDVIYVVEAALIIESGERNDYDVIVVVDCDLESRIERVMRSRGMARDEVLRVERSQMEGAKKRSEADIVIDNSGGIESFKLEAARVFEDLKRMEKEKRSR